MFSEGVCELLSSLGLRRPTESVEHQADHGDLKHSFAVVRQFLLVFAQATRATPEFAAGVAGEFAEGQDAAGRHVGSQAIDDGIVNGDQHAVGVSRVDVGTGIEAAAAERVTRHFPFALSLEPIQTRNLRHHNNAPPRV